MTSISVKYCTIRLTCVINFVLHTYRAIISSVEDLPPIYIKLQFIDFYEFAHLHRWLYAGDMPIKCPYIIYIINKEIFNKFASISVLS